LKELKAMIVFFILTIISGALVFGMQHTTHYKLWAILLLIALISLIASFILSIISFKKHRTGGRGFTIFVLICSSLGILFVLITVLIAMIFV